MFTVEEFKDWLSNQHGCYEYVNHNQCALANYLKYKYPNYDINVGFAVYAVYQKKIPEAWGEIPKSLIYPLLEEPHTYEALKERLQCLE